VRRTIEVRRTWKLQGENKMDDDVDMLIVAETENFSVVRSKDDSGVLYHVELGGVSLHLEPEDWEELVMLIKSADA
jgi:hypothetical protein